MPCQVCGGTLILVWNEGELAARQCRDCSLILSDSPTQFRFENDYFQHYIDQPKACQARIAHFRRLVTECPVAFEPPILDIGAGLGFFIQALSPDLAQMTTLVEPSNFARRHLNNTVRADTFDSLKEIPPEYVQFGTIALWDVLAHVENPRAMLIQARKLMKEEGLLIIKTPFHPLRLFRAAQLLAPAGKGHSLLHIPSMRFHFTPDSLRPLLRAAGFRVETWQWAKESPLINTDGFNLLRSFLLRTGKKAVTKELSFICFARQM